MMNPASIMKLMNAKNKFTENHPKFTAFLNAGEEAVTTNMKITQSDLDLFSELKDLAK